MSAPRFLAVIDPSDAPQAAGERGAELQALKLAERHASEHLVVLTDADTSGIPLGPAGVLIGQAHPQDPATGLGRLASNTRNSGGRLLVDRYWGDYVAFLSEQGETMSRAIRSPSGGVHAFRAVRGATTWIASDIQMLIALAIAEPVIDWTFVAHHLAFPHLRSALTGIAGIDEIQPGECAVIRGAESETLRLWSPWKFAEPELRFRDTGEARIALFETVTTTVEAMTRRDRALLLELSGGIDSSVLAASLAAARAKVSAINFVTPGPEGDERHYARLVAERTGTALTEAQMTGDIDLTEPFHARTARPGIPAMLRNVDRHFIRVAMARGIDAFVSGTGGDSVFCSLGSAAPAADALRTFGLDKQFWLAIRDVATVHDTNIWKVGALAIRQAGRATALSSWPRTSRFLCDQALPREPLPHPWLLEPEGALAGSRAHIRSILAALAHLDGYARQTVAPSIFPLLSQPVIETCLRIPSWMWVDGGRDRAIARQAFSAALPAEITNRRGKGGMDSYCAETFQRNRPRLRPFLLGGHLAAAGLLDRDALDAYLRRSGPLRDTLFYSVLPIVDTEAWLRAWLGDTE